MVPAKTPRDVCCHARVAGFPFIRQCRYLNRSVGGEVGPPGVRPFFMVQHHGHLLASSRDFHCAVRCSRASRGDAITESGITEPVGFLN